MHDPHLATLSSSFTTKKLLAASTKPLIISNLFTNLFGPEKRELLINKNEKMILTSSPLLILENLRLIHPLQILIRTYCEKMEQEGDGALLMITIFNRFLKAVQKALTENIMDIRQVRNSIENLKMNIRNIINKEAVIISDYRKILLPVVHQEKLAELLLEIITQNRKCEIDIIKVEGGIFEDSYVFPGLIAEREVLGFCNKKAGNLKSGIFNAPFDINRTETKGVLLFEEASQLTLFEKNEDKMIAEYINNLSVDLVICQQAAGRFRNLADEREIILLEAKSKKEFMKFQRFLGGKIAHRRENLENEECGSFNSIEPLSLANKKFTQIAKENSDFLTVVLKGTINLSIDENERILNKGLKILKKVVNNQIKMVPGAGKIEKIIAHNLTGDNIMTDLAKNIFLDIALSLPRNDEIFDIAEIKIKSVEYALDLLYDVLACEDYLMVADNE